MTGPGRNRSGAAELAWTGFLLIQVARGFRALLATLLLVAALPLVSLWSGSVVRSGSMEPGMSVGDVIIAQPLHAKAPIPVGRVMVFDNPDRSSPHSTMIHRVVENLGKGQYTTAGDANRDIDSTPVAKDDFTARPIISVPFIGLPLMWWADRDLGPLIFWLALISAALYFSVRPPCDPRHRRRREASKARRAAERAAVGLRRVSIVLVPGCVVLAAVIVSPFDPADAAFTATTRNSGNTWTATNNLAKPIVVDALPAAVRGTVPVTATWNDSYGSGFAVRIEYASAGTTTWSTMCTDNSSPYACNWNTTGATSGTYDVRAVATSGSKSYTSELVRMIVDNTAPSTTMQNPGSPLKGTVTTAATATDAHSGIAKVVIQYAPNGGTTYTDVCTTTTSPYSCQFNTTTIADGTYSFRSVATDVAGNSTTAAVVANRVVNNTVPQVSLNDPGAYLVGTVPLAAVASSSAGITSVRIQRSPAGTGTWTNICTDSATPFTCSWVTTGVADGFYDLRAVMLDNAGTTTVSSTVSSRRVDNRAMAGADVQTANGGSTAGRFERGDSMTLTYTHQASLSSISAGWNGSPTAVTVRLRDGALLGLGSLDDTVTFLRNGVPINLGSVNLRQDYIGALRSSDFAATMTATTTTVNGVTATRVTLVVGSQTNGPGVATVTSSSVIVWTPSGSATNLAGRAASTALTFETGTSDREF